MAILEADWDNSLAKVNKMKPFKTPDFTNTTKAT